MAPPPASYPSPHRPALRPGSLQRLLRPPDPSDTDDAPTPRSRSRARSNGRVLLQVTNITPALSGADPFSGHQGFYLRLSDSARSCYVSLHADHDDLILTNGLHIGQVIEVDHLMPSVPAPVLRSFRVLPGRYPCIQHDSTDDDVDADACSARAEIKDKEVVSERPRPRPRTHRPSPTPPLPERKAWQSGSPATMGHGHRSRSFTTLSEACAAPAKPVRRSEGERRGADFLKKVRKTSVASIDGNSSDVDDDDDESDVSSSISTTRRNWDFTGSIRPVGPRIRSNSISPGRSGPNQSGTANDPLESVRRKAEKAFKVLSKRSAHASSKTLRESSSAAGTPRSTGVTSGIRWCEDNVLWSSLSSSLTRHGKEAVKQRDMALQAVLDGLLEASTTEKLIKCLSTYSELQSDKDDDPKELIDRFLRFSQELDHAIFVAQSQTRLRQAKSGGSNSTSSASSKAAMKAALDRKQSAISWVRAAIEADLSPLSSHTRVTSESAKPSPSESRPVTPRLCCSKTKCNCNGKSSSRKTADASSKLSAAMDLAVALRSECNRWFLKYIDKFLDDVENEAGYTTTCDSQVAGLLQQLKRVDDWLNHVVRHERMLPGPGDRSSRDCVFSEEEENDACERVRRKIYGALLRHVQYAATALESMNSVVTEEEN
ncbi:hypothetical protein CFC21_074668 [Triticum aestivum]|uniref:Uncharacterized protein n=3 Tax=Triticum TaxID=4564 RepID=A0A9R1RJS5_TRITD|nr:uncharacterized protein LOC119360794 [Triticum dicoccoides]XP_044323021.1 uncharacterized protein LOC123044362 [Triticum aestivum]KAF7068971.1 hypothetical protein CFC21_074668 [Triticum aestivum]VAH44254.1 unnamed protein product [Triticum turgidum subsp. durum]